MHLASAAVVPPDSELLFAPEKDREMLITHVMSDPQ
jgi:hypothetical protein